MGKNKTFVKNIQSLLVIKDIYFKILKIWQNLVGIENEEFSLKNSEKRQKVSIVNLPCFLSFFYLTITQYDLQKYLLGIIEPTLFGRFSCEILVLKVDNYVWKVQLYFKFLTNPLYFFYCTTFLTKDFSPKTSFGSLLIQ